MAASMASRMMVVTEEAGTAVAVTEVLMAKVENVLIQLLSSKSMQNYPEV